MKIKMLTLQAGPGGVRRAGTVHNVPDAEAQALIKGGYAVKVEKEAPAPQPRTATRGRGRTAKKLEAPVEATTEDAETGESETEPVEA